MSYASLKTEMKKYLARLIGPSKWPLKTISQLSQPQALPWRSNAILPTPCETCGKCGTQIRARVNDRDAFIMFYTVYGIWLFYETAQWNPGRSLGYTYFSGCMNKCVSLWKRSKEDQRGAKVTKYICVLLGVRSLFLLSFIFYCRYDRLGLYLDVNIIVRNAAPYNYILRHLNGYYNILIAIKLVGYFALIVFVVQMYCMSIIR